MADDPGIGERHMDVLSRNLSPDPPSAKTRRAGRGGTSTTFPCNYPTGMDMEYGSYYEYSAVSTCSRAILVPFHCDNSHKIKRN